MSQLFNQPSYGVTERTAHLCPADTLRYNRAPNSLTPRTNITNQPSAPDQPPIIQEKRHYQKPISDIFAKLLPNPTQPQPHPVIRTRPAHPNPNPQSSRRPITATKQTQMPTPTPTQSAHPTAPQSQRSTFSTTSRLTRKSEISRHSLVSKNSLTSSQSQRGGLGSRHARSRSDFVGGILGKNAAGQQKKISETGTKYFDSNFVKKADANITGHVSL